MRNYANLLSSFRSKIVPAAFAALMCCAVGLGFVATTLGSAYAAQGQSGTLTPQQVAAIQAQINAAIAAVNMQQFNTMVVDPAALALCNCGTSNGDTTSNKCDNPAKNAALAQAIADLTVNLLGTYGSGAASEIASIILATAMSAGVPSSAIGAGLGKGAQQVAQNNGAAAILIAQVLANEGTADIANCFASAVGSQQLASIALGPPSTTAAGGPGGGGAPGGGAPGVVPVLAATSS